MSRRAAVLIGLAALLVTCAVSGVVILGSDDPVAAVSLVSTLLGLVATVTAMVRWLWVRRRDAAGPSRSSDLAHAADELASVLTEQWRAEALNRGLVLPSPVGVRWMWSERARSVRVHEAGQPDGIGPAAIPAASPELLTEGTIDRLHDLYTRAEAGRLTIIGAPGSGKTAAAILLLLRAIKYRESLGEARAAVPVPVLLTFSDWDPAQDALVSWASARLLRDYPVLTRYPQVTRLSGELISQGRVSLLLDGFDEMSPESRPRALQRLDELPGTRIVVLTRPAEYEAASRAALGRVVLQLLPVDARSAASYLVSGQPSEEADAWRELANEVESHPDGALAAALSTPLMLNLARTTYQSGAAPTELLDLARTATNAEVEDLLLDRFVDHAYRDPASGPGPAPARRWLGHLASQMQRRQVRDLYWWHVAGWFSRWRLAAMAGIAFVVSVLPLVVLGAVLSSDRQGVPSWESALFLVYLLVLFFAAGLMLGLGGFGGFMVRRAGFRQALSETSAAPRWRDARAVLVMVAALLPIRVAFVPISDDRDGVLDVLAELVVVAGFPLLVALALRLAGFNAGSPVALRLAWPRGSDLVQGALVGAAAGFLVAVADRGFATRTETYESRTYELLVQPLEFVATGLLAGVVAGGVAGLVRAGSSSFTWGTPARLWRSDVRSAAVAGTLCVVIIGLINLAFEGNVDMDLLVVLLVAAYLFVVAAVLNTEAARLTMAAIVLHRRGDAPLRFLRFLDDARARSVLRQAGPTYQFRHARLQDRLATAFDAEQAPDRPDRVVRTGRYSDQNV